MKNNYNNNSIKEYVKTKNAVFYGTIRDIQDDFLSSFINLELLSKLFNKTYFIILENDSIDNTRKLLESWSQINPSTKKIIWKHNLNQYFPLRATRLAYCRNEILNYMKEHKFQETYDFAIHCDLDNRFWSMNPECIYSCFANPTIHWDMMSAVCKDRHYYDFWALRCDQSWFNKNIFSCEAEGINFETKIKGFETLLKNTEQLIPVLSCFNGLAIYKITSLLHSSYSANYYCNKCHNVERGCWEDNDHIGLHKQMIHNGCALFINNKLEITTREDTFMPYYKFIENVIIVDLKKNVLNWLLYSNKINLNHYALCVGNDIKYEVNSIAKYYAENKSIKNVLLLFREHNVDHLNKNIEVIHNLHNRLVDLSEKDYLSVIYFIESDYISLKSHLETIKSKITPGTILVFKKLINFENYYIHEIKAFYEFVQINKVKFEWIGYNSLHNEQTMVALKILHIEHCNDGKDHFHFTDDCYINFDWVQYTNYYSDLQHVSNKEDAFKHWLLYGKNEGRSYFQIPEFAMTYEDNNDNQVTNNDNQVTHNDHINNGEHKPVDFDWEMYLDINYDLIMNGITIEDDAITHWIKHGKYENRKYRFDWCKYIESNNLVNIKIDNKEKAIKHWKDNGCPEIIEHDLNNELFDWKYYVTYNNDLNHITNMNDAKYHWMHFGKDEGRLCHNFNWMEYILQNPELMGEQGIDTEIKAARHWIAHKT